MMNKKGQWFFIAAFIFITLISGVALSKTMIKIPTSIEPQSKYIFDNIKSESQAVVNVIINENATSTNLEDRLEQYTDFIENYAKEHNIELSGYFIVGLPTNNNLNITISNFLNNNISNITVFADDQSVSIQNLQDSNVTTETISAVPNDFRLQYNITFLNSTNQEESESSIFNVTRRVFNIFRVRTETSNEVWQAIKIN